MERGGLLGVESSVETEATALSLAALHLHLRDLLSVDALRFLDHKRGHLGLQVDTPACSSPSATHLGWPSSDLPYALS